MTWTPIGKRGDGGGREQITNRIAQNRTIATQKAELTKQKAELKKMNLVLKQKSKEESIIPTFKREIQGKSQKKFNRAVRTSQTSEEFKLYTEAMAEKSFTKRPGDTRPRKMNQEEFNKLLQNLNEKPLNPNTRRHVKTLEKHFKSL